MIKDIWLEFKIMLKAVTPAQAIARELVEAEMALLRAETGVEWAQASATYNKSRIKRLKAYMAVTTTEETKETT